MLIQRTGNKPGWRCIGDSWLKQAPAYACSPPAGLSRIIKKEFSNEDMRERREAEFDTYLVKECESYYNFQ